MKVNNPFHDQLPPKIFTWLLFRSSAGPVCSNAALSSCIHRTQRQQEPLAYADVKACEEGGCSVLRRTPAWVHPQHTTCYGTLGVRKGANSASGGPQMPLCANPSKTCLLFELKKDIYYPSLSIQGRASASQTSHWKQLLCSCSRCAPTEINRSAQRFTENLCIPMLANMDVRCSMPVWTRF